MAVQYYPPPTRESPVTRATFSARQTLIMYFRKRRGPVGRLFRRIGRFLPFRISRRRTYRRRYRR